MATILLSVAGAAAGNAIGGTVLGLSAASIGQAIGGIAGAAIDSMILGGGGGGGRSRIAAPEVKLTEPTTATEGAPVERVWGTHITGGQVIWSARYLVTTSVTVTTEQSSGGKGFGGAGAAQTTETETNHVSLSFAVALAEGEIDGVGTIWADGYPLRKDRITLRVYRGTEDQLPDPTIAATEGVAPAYRGLAYVVFEAFDLTPYGNRLPQLSFEVRRGARRFVRPAGPGETDVLEHLVKGVCLIPATGKWSLHPRPIVRSDGQGGNAAVNRFSAAGVSDVVASLDALQQRCPNLQTVSLFVGWFGDDLRAANCTVEPRAESREDVFVAAVAPGNSGSPDTLPTVGVDAAFAPGAFDDDAITGAGLGVFATGLAETATQNVWKVSGLGLETVTLTSTVNGRPAYGATPSDRSVFTLIRELRARGLNVMICPFLLMDVPIGNALPDPHGGAAQAPYPWRGRITTALAPGQPGTTDKTAAAGTEVAAFFGTAASGHFGAWDGRTIPYSGPADGNYRRFVLHYAKLAAAAGGVEGFLIGSEMRGLTQIRDDAASYPAVAALRTLAADIAAILPAARLGYAADWSEYFGHQPSDGTGDVFFHLDPLWSDANIDFVGIDNYLPISDWRHGGSNIDYDEAAGPRTAYDLTYLKANVEGGERADWYYASDADRTAQVRTTITDGAYGEPWVFSPKRVREWWSNLHHDRPGGVRSATPTGWTAGMKPVIFTEFGCPALDLGTNQPNVFLDPKSSESFAPYFSTATPDPVIQRQYLKAMLNHWAANMPMLGGQPMLDLDWCCAYAWDARPYPEFPVLGALWADAPQYETGHWLTGRLGQVEIGAVLDDMAAAVGLAVDRTDAFGLAEGYLLDGGTAPRGPMEQLAALWSIDLVEEGGALLAISRIAARAYDVSAADLAVAGTAEPARITRGQETELPIEIEIVHHASRAGFRPRATGYRRRAGQAQGKRQLNVPVAASTGEMRLVAETLLMEEWQAIDRMVARLRPSELALRPGDLVRLTHAGRVRTFRLTGIGQEWGRPAEGVGADPGIYNRAGAAIEPAPGGGSGSASPGGAAVLKRMDLPLLAATAAAHAPYFAGYAAPFPTGGIAVWRSSDGATFEIDSVVAAPSVIGALTAPLPAGPAGVFDRGAAIEVGLFGGALAPATDARLFTGANAAAILGTSGEWEVVQFGEATLTAPGQWRLTRLRRARGGTEDAMGAATGAPFVLLSAALVQPSYAASDRGRVFDWRYGPAALGADDPGVQAFTSGFRGRGLVPVAPARPRAKRLANGDIALHFRRRSRLGGGGLRGTPALGFAAERYRARIWSGAAVVREIDGTASPLTYTLAGQVADLGARPTVLDWEIHQRDDQGLIGTGARQSQRV